MFLTKRSYVKIALTTALYLLLGTACIVLGVFFEGIGEADTMLYYIGFFMDFLAVVMFICGRYNEGIGKLMLLGSKLLRKELKPREFLAKYDSVRMSKDLVVNKPCVDVLQYAIIAYDMLDDRESSIAAADEMIAVAGEKRKAQAMLAKVSLLFSHGRIQEAEVLFAEARKHKYSFICTAMTDSIIKVDRAVALGDYKLAEASCLKTLERKFPKLDNYERLANHYKLGEIYEGLGERAKAAEHYRYCVENGGETAFPESAKNALARLG